ncbi:MAG: hypothetical protein MI922_21245 [Bacteroidales bacterium]|nr:hypothetical protein [Bacteroidales bacterium]
MSGYKKLYDIALSHSYFKNGNCNVLSVLPTENTIELFANADLLIRSTDKGISISYNTDFPHALDAYKKEKVSFTFKITSKDTYFHNYTDYGHQPNKILLFNSANTKVENGIYNLSKDIVVSKKDEKVVSDKAFDGILNKNDRVNLPVGVINIRLADVYPVKKEGQSPIYSIQFKPRATYWRYNLIKRNDAVYDDLIIVDNHEKITFTEKKTVGLSNGQEADQILSGEPILFKEYSDCHFNLLGIVDDNKKMIINRLSHPDIRQITNEGKKYISDLYVYY